MGPESQKLPSSHPLSPWAQSANVATRKPDLPRSRLLPSSHPTHTLAAGSPSTTLGIEGQTLPRYAMNQRTFCERNVAWHERTKRTAPVHVHDPFSCQIDQAPPRSTTWIPQTVTEEDRPGGILNRARLRMVLNTHASLASPPGTCGLQWPDLGLFTRAHVSPVPNHSTKRRVRIRTLLAQCQWPVAAHGN